MPSPFKDQPEPKKVAPPNNDSFGNQLPPMHQQQRSVMTEEYKVPDGMVGFIIDALQRARQIAAKIGNESGTSVNSNDYSYGGQKRPLEDG
uniref:Uncharacterized protein n=1 Tax=Ailuropoda melanoleuca TaxID=9646 RepID=A0A7N5P6E0_AILME